MVLLPQISTEVYRGLVRAGDLVTSRILVKQTDLLVSGFKDLKEEAAALVHTYRQKLVEGQMGAWGQFELVS